MEKVPNSPTGWTWECNSGLTKDFLLEKVGQVWAGSSDPRDWGSRTYSTIFIPKCPGDIIPGNDVIPEN